MSGKGAPGNLGGELFLYAFPAMSMMRSEVCIWTNPADGQVWAFTPGHNGIAGFKVMIDASGNPSLVLAWSDVFSTVHFNTSAFVANNVLYAATGGGEHTSAESPRQVNAMDPTTGAVLWSGAINQFHWSSPILANGILYMADGPAGGFGSGAGDLTAWSLGSTGPTPVADPVFAPPAGNYSASQSVAISTTTASASIRYTVDGSIPSETAGTLYNGTPITISANTTLKAIAFKSGMSDSNVVVGNYTIGALVASAPTFNAPGHVSERAVGIHQHGHQWSDHSLHDRWQHALGNERHGLFRPGAHRLGYHAASHRLRQRFPRQSGLKRELCHYDQHADQL